MEFFKKKREAQRETRAIVRRLVSCSMVEQSAADIANARNAAKDMKARRQADMDRLPQNIQDEFQALSDKNLDNYVDELTGIARQTGCQVEFELGREVVARCKAVDCPYVTGQLPKP